MKGHSQANLTNPSRRARAPHSPAYRSANSHANAVTRTVKPTRVSVTTAKIEGSHVDKTAGGWGCVRAAQPRRCWPGRMSGDRGARRWQPQEELHLSNDY